MGGGGKKNKTECGGERQREREGVTSILSPCSALSVTGCSSAVVPDEKRDEKRIE